MDDLTASRVGDGMTIERLRIKLEQSDAESIARGEIIARLRAENERLREEIRDATERERERIEGPVTILLNRCRVMAENGCECDRDGGVCVCGSDAFVREIEMVAAAIRGRE